MCAAWLTCTCAFYLRNAISNVTLTYRVMYSNEVTVPMFDDGLHADGFAGDGVWRGQGLHPQEMQLMRAF